MEAHAIDTWPLPNPKNTYNNKPVQVRNHVTMKDRIKIANDFFINYDLFPYFNCYIDLINNNIEKQFGGWPFRYAVIDNNIMKLQMEHSYHSNITSLTTYLTNNE